MNGLHWFLFPSIHYTTYPILSYAFYIHSLPPCRLDFRDLHHFHTMLITPTLRYIHTPLLSILSTFLHNNHDNHNNHSTTQQSTTQQSTRHNHNQINLKTRHKKIKMKRNEKARGNRNGGIPIKICAFWRPLIVHARFTIKQKPQLSPST